MPASAVRLTCRPRLPVLILLLLASVCRPLVAVASPAPPELVRLPDATLIDQQGRTVELAELVRGRRLAMQFIFTTCTTVCSPMGARFARLQHDLAERGTTDVAFVSISIDPTTDTPERLRAWAERFGGSPEWRLLTGEKAEIDRLLRELGVFSAVKTEHAPLVLLGDPARGRFVRAHGLADPSDLIRQLDELSGNVAADACLPPEALAACPRTLNADVVALDQPFFYNRLGASQPNGQIFALRADVVCVEGSTSCHPDSLAPGEVMLRPDKRARPLVLRVAQGDCLRIEFENLLAPTPNTAASQQAFDDAYGIAAKLPIPATNSASVHVTGMSLVGACADGVPARAIDADGSYVGANGNSLARPSDGGPTSWRANVELADPAQPGGLTGVRELALEFQDMALSYPRETGLPPDPLAIADLCPSCPGPMVGAAIGPSSIANKFNYGVGYPTAENSAGITAPVAPWPQAVSFGAMFGGYTINYRSEPLAPRVAGLNGEPPPARGQVEVERDYAHVYRSLERRDPALNVQPDWYPPLTGGVLGSDPYTQLLEAYAGDKVQIRTLTGAHFLAHQFTLRGLPWLFEPSLANSGYRATQTTSLSEHFEMNLTLPREPGAEPVDYLYQKSLGPRRVEPAAGDLRPAHRERGQRRAQPGADRGAG